MNRPLTLSSIGLIILSFVISFFATLAMKRLAPRIGFVDKPGGRKINANPKPLGGGLAIFLGFALPVLIGLIVIHGGHAPAAFISSSPGHPSPVPAYWSGVRDRTPVALELVGAALVMHLLGLWDDRKALGPYSKLLVQLAVITGLVVSNDEIRALTFLGTAPSIILTVLW